MKKINYAFLLFTLLLLGHWGIAQCPNGAFTISIANIVPASCPSNGSVTIGATVPASSLKYEITSGPAGAPVHNISDPNTFSSLPAGNYTLDAFCAANPSRKESISFTIPNTYTPMTDQNVTTTVIPNCGSNPTPGGTITITTTGGKANLQYSCIESSNPGYDDSQSIYGSSNTFSLNKYGTYQVRVKDACGIYYTKSITLAAPPPVYFDPYGTPTGTLNDQTCNSTFSTGYNLKSTVTDNTVDKTVYITPGFTLDVYDNVSQTKLTPTPIFVSSKDNVVLPQSPSKKYKFVLTDPCGQKTERVWDGTNSTTSHVFYKVDGYGCGTAGSPETMTIGIGDSYFLKYPAQLEIRTSGGTLVYSETLTDGTPHLLKTGLPKANYTVTIRDACNTPLSQALGLSSGNINPGYYTTNFECVWGEAQTVVGSSSGTFYFSGNIPDRANATITIEEGPSQVGVAGYKDLNGHYSWMNLLPGTYKFKIHTTCGDTILPAYTPAFKEFLKRSITATATTNCDGKGTVTGDVVFNGAAVVTYSLLNATTNAIVFPEQPGSTFSDVPPGDYKISMNIYYVCIGVRQPAVPFLSNTVTIADKTKGPEITKKIGVICEDVNGTPLNTGTAYLQLAGSHPLTLKYKKESASAWETYPGDAPDLVILPNLEANAKYDFELIGCIGNDRDEIQINPLSSIQITNTLHPCLGSNYTLTTDEIPGATYEWKKTGSNFVFSTTYNYLITDYDPLSDGTYECKVSFGNCLSRTDNVTLNSTKCGTPLPVKLASFKGNRINGSDQLAWITATEVNTREFQVEYSIDGKKFATAGRVDAKNNSVVQQQYYFTNPNVSGSTYYRLKMVDMDGSATYSHIIKIYGSKNENGSITSNVIYPIPFTTELNINVSSSKSQSATFTLFSIDGKIVTQKSMPLQQGAALYTLNNLNNLPSGTYILRIQSTDGVITEKVVK